MMGNQEVSPQMMQNRMDMMQMMMDQMMQHQQWMWQQKRVIGKSSARKIFL